MWTGEKIFTKLMPELLFFFRLSLNRPLKFSISLIVFGDPFSDSHAPKGLKTIG